MPLHGKIVVIKRSGGDGTEFPLTATCLFGRKPECDIRIQLPQVSKEHCRIDFNENKEVILTNLSSVNPTCVNGAVLQQSERLKHGDVITVIDRSFRFEYPPAPTPRKRSSTGGKPDFKVLQDQQVRERSVGENRTSETSTGPHLKDGTNQDNTHRLLEKTVELESKEEEKSTSPFNDLYQMIKKSLDVKTPRRSSISHQQTPSSRCSPKPVSVKKNSESLVFLTKDKATPKKDEIESFPVSVEIDTMNNGTSKPVKKQRNSTQLPSNDISMPEVQNAKAEAPSVQKRISVTPQRFTSSNVVEQVTSQNSKSTVRRSKEATSAKQAVTSPKTESHTKASPRNFGNVETASKKRKGGELSPDLPKSQMKRKRVSFGSNLSPELFDKRMPPDSPLRKGATPRRSFCLSKPKESLLRRVSVIGMIQEHPDYQSPAKMKTPSPKKSPMTQLTGKKSPRSRSSSPKAETPGKKTPKSKSTSPKAETPGKKTPKSKSPSPKAETPGKKTPKSKSPSPKAEIPGKKTPKSKSPSPKAETPGKKTPKSKSPSPRAETPGKKTPKSKSPSPRAETPGKKTPKSKSPSPKAETPRAGLSQLNAITIKGRFSVSRISTPSPTAEGGDANKVCLDNVTPKLCLKRKSMKSSAQKSVVRSAVKVMCRKSVISRASMKAMNSWADIVKFGQRKTPVGRPVKTKVNKTTTKKAVREPQTPASKCKDQVTTGHAESPVTIVVGRAHRKRVACPTGAAPRWISNTGLLKTNMKMDEDLTGISEMYKTPVVERKQRAVTTGNGAKTPVGDLNKSVVEPSVLNTPEEPGEMMVSPLSVSTVVKDRSYNHEAVQRLFIGEHGSIFVSEIPAMEVAGDSPEQSTDSKTTKQEPVLPNWLTEVNRVKRIPRQKAEPLENLCGKVLKTPKQKIEHQECLTGVKRIMKTPQEKAKPLEDIRGKILKTPKQKIEQQECLTGVKRIMKTPKQNAEPLEDLRGKILITPKEKIEPQECLTGIKRIFSTPQQLAEDPQHKYLGSHEAASSDCVDLSGMLHRKIPPASESSLVCLSGVERLMTTPRVKASPVEDMIGVKRLLKTPREKGEPVADNFGIKRLLKSPKLKATAPVEDFEGLKELMKEPLVDPMEQQEINEIKDQTTDGAKEADKNEVAADDHVEQVLHRNESSDTRQTIQAAQESEVIRTDDLSKEKLKPQTAVRGRRAKMEEGKSVEVEQKATADSEESAISAPVRGRIRKKTEAKAEITQQPILRQTRSRNAKLQECKSKKVPEESVHVTQVSEVDAEAVSVESSTLSPHHREAATKPTRGRKTKQSLTKPFQPEPEKEEAVSEEQSPDNDKPEKPCPTLRKNTRGKRTKTDDVQTAAVEKREPKPAPPIRAKRGRINKQESVEKETSQSQEPVKNLGRTRRVKQDPVEPSIVQNYEEEHSKEAEAPVDTKPKKVEPNMATRTRHAQKAAQVKQLAESDDVQNTAAISVADKPTRGRRGKQVGEDMSALMSEEKPELKAEDENNEEQEATVVKRRAKSVKNNVPETIPAKRARRGASLPPVETKTESADLGSKSESYSKELPKRGRRAAKPSADVAILSGEELKSAVGEDAKMPAKSVKWKSDVQVFEIQKLTPVKPVRGRKSKFGDRVDTKSQKDSSKIEEKYLSDKVEVQATKRTRRGVVIVEEESSKGEHVEPETQPKTRRGRLAKK